MAAIGGYDEQRTPALRAAATAWLDALKLVELAHERVTDAAAERDKAYNAKADAAHALRALALNGEYLCVKVQEHKGVLLSWGDGVSLCDTREITLT